MLTALPLLHRQAIDMVNITVILRNLLLFVLADEPARFGGAEADIFRVQFCVDDLDDN